jgi:hypothetical protein
MKRLVRIALLLFGLVWVAAVIGALLRKSQALPMSEPDEDEVTLSAVFAPLAFRSTAQAFRGGTIDCWFGGGTIDLRGARLDPAGALLEAKAVFGGGQIVVPADWHVVVHSRGLGGVGRMGSTEAGDLSTGPTLTLDVVSLFGGFGISTDLKPDAEHWLDEVLRRQGASTDPGSIA